MSTRSRSRPTSPAVDERYDNPLSRSDEEDFKSSQLPSSRGSRRDYDGETDEESLDTDAEDRKLEGELWDEEEVVGAETGKAGKRQWVMNAVGKSGSRSQQYSSVGDNEGGASRSGSRRSNSTRSAGGGSSRRSSTRRMNALGSAAAGGAAFTGGPSEKGLRRLSLPSSSPPPPPGPAKKSRTRCALWICLALLLVAIVAAIVAGVMIQKNRSNSVSAANSTSAGDNVSLLATGTDAQGNTLYATISGSGSAGGASASGASSAQDGQYASSLNSLGQYPGKASEFDNGQYHSSAGASAPGSGSESAQATATDSHATETGSTGSSSANDGLYHPLATSSSSSATNSAQSQSSATSLSGSQSSGGSFSSSSSSSSSSDDSWNLFGWGDDDSSTSSDSSASSTNSGSSNPASAPTSAPGTSVDWSTYGGHGLGDSNGQGSSSPLSSSGATDASQQQAGWGASPTSSPSSSATDSAALDHGGPQQMSVMTWGTQVITAAGGGATALSGSQTQSAQGGWQTGSPSSSAQDWAAAPSSTSGPGGWAAAPSATASPSSPYSASNFSMAVQPESWQKYQGSATWFTSDRHLSPCGIAGNDTDYLVALPLSIYMTSLGDPSSVQSKYCGAAVTVTSLSDGASINAWVSGACAYCDGETSLDLSQAAFAALSTSQGLNAGTLDIIWGFQEDASDANAPFGDSTATTVATSWMSGRTIAAQAVQAGW